MQHKRMIKSTARIMLFVLVYELVIPNLAMALTTGPSQPEVQSFEPVGTTDMVDMFTGDFNYNIPLLDVEGYPVNIAYHGGVGMEQEATWTGTGWNINPGEINRSVRGIPDDFNGEKLDKEVNIKDEKILRLGMGIGGELVGVGDPLIGLSANLGANLNISNYRGVSCDFDLGAGVNLFHMVSAGVNVGVGSQTGASIDYNTGISFASSQILSKDVAAGIGINVGSGYSTRTGMKDLNFSISASAHAYNGNGNISSNVTVPISMHNYVPVITNSSTMNTIYGRLKLGGELFWCNIYGNISAMGSTLHHNNDGTRKSYGYFYSQNAGKEDIMDFTRDKDGMFNKTMEYLPMGNMTYDIYSVSGQGTGGNFRPFRNDIGSVFDPLTESSSNSESLELEGSLGWIFAVGADGKLSETKIQSGPWTDYLRTFSDNKRGSLYENVYLKQSGEHTSVNAQYFQDIKQFQPLSRDEMNNLPGIKAFADTIRDVRANVLSYLSASQASVKGAAINRQITNFKDSTGFAVGPEPTKELISRSGGNALQRRDNQLSEITQTQTDGRRYIYGIPAMNNIQKEATFSVESPANSIDLGSGQVSFSPGTEDAASNDRGLDHYYSATVTPSFAHSYLLTSVLSTDYTDITGNGPSDDDLGSYTKFNYSLKEKDYRWRAPYSDGSAQYSPGFWSDTRDDKGSYMAGSRESWLLHSIETKNYVAEFYTSKRNDGKGASCAIGNYEGITTYGSTASTPASSYKLDSIKLFNKHDRFINTSKAEPIKTVYFKYDYSLCAGIPNVWNNVGTSGKLTLKKIFIKYGTSEKGMVSPYQFEYSGLNPSYDLAAKDRWGQYKPNGSFTNYQFPYVKQDDTTNFAEAWSLKKITLPSGGQIQVNYESDDYAYVQDKPAAEMFMVAGIGNTSNYTNYVSQLYFNKNAPNLYVYFKRRPGQELSSNIKKNYLNGLSNIYFNFNLRLRESYFEQIKGYATAEDMGKCANDTNYGWVRLAPVEPTGGGAKLHPAAFTAINTGRYNLPHILFPGSDPNMSGLSNILAGLKQAFSELVSITQNPVIKMAEQGRAQDIDMSKSFIRLSSPGMAKKGGGQRVKSMYFNDSWNALAGGNENDAQYGKQYDYTIKDDEAGGVVSSGVASYEPMIGGDENPWRNPVQFTVQNGSSWPPNDPVDLYQETPIGESLFPSPLVGYRSVTVKSIHADVGRSAQGKDVYQFYTAKDFPVQVKNTGLETVKDEKKFGFFDQYTGYYVAQGYTLIFNDMHGKPKSTEHYVHKPQGNTDELINYTNYVYNTTNGQLDNNVDVFQHVANSTSGVMLKVKKLVGVESDVTIDTRQKVETTKNINGNINVNTSGLAFIILPIFFGFGWGGQYDNEFKSVVTTKTIQQYGILKEVQNYSEGAVTTVRNEVYDPANGQAVVTSVDNQYRDKEYSVELPAYWFVKNMGSSYNNIGYEDSFTSVAVQNYEAQLTGNTILNYNIGDELLLYFQNGSTWDTTTAWVTRVGSFANDCCRPIISPRFKTNTANWPSSGTLSKVYTKVLRSGRRNQISGTTVSTYKGLDNVIQYGNLIFAYEKAIELKAQFIWDQNTATLPSNYFYNDSINPFVDGTQGNYRPWTSFAYLAARTNTTMGRTAGLFRGTSYYGVKPIFSICAQGGDAHCVPSLSPYANSYIGLWGNWDNWKTTQEVTKYAPGGEEIENRDPTGIYTSAVLGYNEDLPVAVAQNARQGEVLAESFEDYRLLTVMGNVMAVNYSPIRSLFSLQSLSGSSTYGTVNPTGPGGLVLTRNAGHSGFYGLKVTSNYSLSITNLPPVYNYFISVYNRFGLQPNKSYIVSYWIKPVTASPNAFTYSLPFTNMVTANSVNYIPQTKSNVIEGWQQLTTTFKTGSAGSATINLPGGYYVDDIRVFPADANMKSFVYHPFNQKLMATLDENNYATFYEYDQQGTLVRTKKETERGVMTISESRQANPAK